MQNCTDSQNQLINCLASVLFLKVSPQDGVFTPKKGRHYKSAMNLIWISLGFQCISYGFNLISQVFPKSGLEKVLRLCIKTCTQTGPKSIAQRGVPIKALKMAAPSKIIGLFPPQNYRKLQDYITFHHFASFCES